jgi:hypothetical protein|tara:strand:+ start:177 stop:2132 length:1956 start_codon:yes stop_codon:yes gene_type:complete
MAQTTKRLRVTELDFDEIKTNLKTHLQTQDSFKDYNFEGSAMNTLLDVLSYNTHYNAVYGNMVANEMFLDSAVKRDSVVSLAKHLGYTPRSSVSSTARLNVTINSPSGSPASLTMNKGTVFRARVSGTNYQFVNTSDITITPTEGVYSFTNIDVKEGTLLTLQYTKDSNLSSQRFLLEEPSIDITTLKVTIQTSVTDVTQEVYTEASNILDIGSTSKVYFVDAVDSGHYEVTFGDDVLGKALSDGNIVVLEYIVCNEEDSNGASDFTLQTGVGGSTNATITTVISAQNGGPRETVDSIKFNAPKYYSSQNRAVTAEDYKVILPKLYNNVDTMQVWGGEDNDPPVYGKVFMAIKPKTGKTLTTSTKNAIKSTYLAGKTMVSITPEIIDAKYICILPTINVYWNPNITTATSSDIATRVRAVVETYANNDIKNFDSVFRYSQFVNRIDLADPGIVSNVTTIRCERHFDAILNTESKYTLDFYNPLFTQGKGAPTNLSSTGFTIGGRTQTLYLDDDGDGNIRSYYLEEGSSTKVIVNATQGAIDYSTGKIVIDQLNITSTVVDGNEVEIFVTLNSNDVVSVREILLMINPLTVVVNTIVDKIATGESSAGVQYITTSSSELSKTGGTGAAGATSTVSVGSSSSSSSSESSGSGY